MNIKTDQYTLFPEVFVKDRHAVCSSLDVAAHFGKQHTHVLRNIKRQMRDCSPGFRESNFGLTFIDVPGPNGAVRQSPTYTLTRDAFALLAMSFTGSEATAWKIAYLEAFNRMEAELVEAARREAELEGRLEAARQLVGEKRTGLADQAMLLLEEGATQANVARLLRVSRHVVYRLRRRFGFLAETTV